MTEAEILKITLRRMGWTITTAAQMFNIPRGTLAMYTSGRARVPGRIWLYILEHEARVYEHTQEITARAKALSNGTGTRRRRQSTAKEQGPADHGGEN